MISKSRISGLFAAAGTDLRTSLRDGSSDEELLNSIISVWQGRTDRYSELRARNAAPADKVEMYYIGG